MNQSTEPKYTKGNRLYFSPSLERMPHGSAIPAGMVTVAEVVDHGTSDLTRDRWTYVVKTESASVWHGSRHQGAAESELHTWKQ